MRAHIQKQRKTRTLHIKQAPRNSQVKKMDKNPSLLVY